MTINVHIMYTSPIHYTERTNCMLKSLAKSKTCFHNGDCNHLYFHTPSEPPLNKGSS